MRILNLNKLSLGTLSFSSQLEKYKFAEAFADTALSRWGKFAGNVNQWLQVTFTATTKIYHVYILYSNITEAGTVTLQCSNDSFATISESHALAKCGKDWIYRNDAGLNYKAYRVVCTDSSVTYIRLSKLYLGGYTQMPGMTEISKPIKSNSKSDKSDSGQLYGYKVTQLRQLNVTFDVVDADEYEEILAWFAEFDKVTPVYCMLFEDTPSERNNLYCNIADDLDPKQAITAGEVYAFGIKLEECK